AGRVVRGVAARAGGGAAPGDRVVAVRVAGGGVVVGVLGREGDRVEGRARGGGGRRRDLEVVGRRRADRDRRRAGEAGGARGGGQVVGAGREQGRRQGGGADPVGERDGARREVRGVAARA